jgi:YD repeat-containing protein
MAHTARSVSAYPARPLFASLLLGLALLMPGLVRAQTGTITYIYDDLGRLVGVVDPAGDAVTYTYDAVGNVQSISRQSSSLVSVIEFTPDGGAVGTTVTIYGTGFSTTASQNAVTFNGVAATVTSASATSLVTTVPTGATTGTISVTTPSGSDASSTSFTVADSAPTITGFTPTIGTPGTAVNITGTNFETSVANNRVKFNGTLADLTTAAATSVDSNVPAASGSGRITLSAPLGTATSSADFFIPPSPYAAADVVTTGRMAIGDSRAVAVGTAGKIGLIVFDGTAGQRVCLKITGVTLSGGTSVEVKIRKVDGSVLASAISGTGGEFIDTVTLPKTGSYTIQVDPTNTATGSVTLNLYNVAADVTGPITPGGSALTVTTTTPGQNARLTFSGSASQRVSLKVSGVSMTGGTNNWVNVYIKKPDGTTLASDTFASGGGLIDTVTLPTAGTYTVVVDPTNTSTGSATLTLYDVPADVTTSILPDATPVTVTTTGPGQNAKLTFSGVANQRVSLKITGVSMTGGTNNWVNVSLRKPDNTSLTSTTVDSSGGFFDTQTLPTTGTYTVFVDPTNTSTGSATLTLYDVPADVTGTITPGGSAESVTMSTPGQNAQLTFSGTVDQRVSLRITGVTLNGNSWVNVYIRKPDGTNLASTTFDSSGGFIDVKTLPVTGTYTVVIDPYKTNTGGVTATLYDVPADASDTATVNGGGVGVTTTVYGQNAFVTFGGTSAQQVTVRVTNNTMGTVTVRLLKPDGTQLTSSVANSSSFNLSTQTLPTTGTYKVSIDPNGTNTGGMTVSVTNP